MQFIFIVAAFVIIVVVLNVVKEAKKEKAKKDAEAAMRKFDEKEELRKFVEPKPSASVSEKPAPIISSASNTSAEKSAQARLATRLQQLQKLESELQSMGHHDDEHCAVKHEPTGSYRVEKVPVMNSIGGQSTEGCADHYDVRYVKIDEKVVEKRELTDLQKIVVYGELINHPMCRRSNRR